MNSFLKIGIFVAALILAGQPVLSFAKPVTVDVAVGETYVYQLQTGEKKKITVNSYREYRDRFRNAVRRAEVDIDVDGVKATIQSALYNLPKVVNGVKLDVAVTKGYMSNTDDPGVWDLAPNADVRLRFWDPDQPLLESGTFVYPVKQRWFASDTQMANDPCYVDGGEDPTDKSIYYHDSLDFGGYDHWTPVFAATDGEIVSVSGAVQDGLPAKYSFITPRYDVVYIRDNRGWYYRYSHFSEILPHIQLGYSVKKGEWIGILGKEGASGGWSHLHFGVFGTEGDERGVIDAYPFIVEAYCNGHANALLAVARPHHYVAVGETVTLDGSNSICQGGEIVSYRWTFSDGGKADGAKVERVYDRPGVYSEILWVKDNRGQVDADFAVIHVLSEENTMEKRPPSIHPSYFPTEGIKPGDEVFMKVRTFTVKGGKEIWDFGDGLTGETRSPNEYATISHHYEKPGLYIVTIRRDSENGVSAMARLKIFVEEK